MPLSSEDLQRLLMKDSQTKRAPQNLTRRRVSRAFVRYLVAIGIGVAGTLAWQSYGEATKRIIATSAPELDWSPEAKEVIASRVQELVSTTPPPGAENAAVQRGVLEPPQVSSGAQKAPQTYAPKAPLAT